MKKRLYIVLVVVLSLSLLAACGSNNSATNNSGKSGGSLAIAVPGDPLVLNPNYASAQITLTIQQALYSPLFYINSRKKAGPSGP